MRKWFFLVSLVPLLTGCSPEVVGRAGVGVDSGGQPVGYLAVCDEQIDVMSLYDDSADGQSDALVTAGRWSPAEPISSFASWSMSAKTSDWSTLVPLGRLDPKRSYSLVGYSSDSSTMTGRATFTVADLRNLAPGEVWYFDHPDDANRRDVYVAGTVEEFRQSACDL